MTGPGTGAGSNPLAGGSSANTPAANPLAGGLPNQPPAQTGTNPAAGAGSNPPAGASHDPQATSPGVDENAPVPADVYREKARAEAKLRQENREFRERLQALEDAKLSEVERVQKRAAEAEKERDDLLLDRQKTRLQHAVDVEARALKIGDADYALYLLNKDFADEITFDADGVPDNVPYLMKRLIDKKPALVEPEPAPQPQFPTSGRFASPPRPPGAGASRPAPEPQPRPLTADDALGKLDWSQATRRQAP